MTYIIDTAQFHIYPSLLITKEIVDPIVIIDGRVSNILNELEEQARKLCDQFIW